MSIKPILKSADKVQAAMEFAQPKASEGELKRINVNVPAELHKALKVRAAAEGVSISELVKQWVESWVKK